MTKRPAQSARYGAVEFAFPEGICPPAGSGIIFEAWMDSQAAAICRGEWKGWPTVEGFDLLREALQLAGAEEGALWLVDDLKREFRPCFSVGTNFATPLAEIRQPLNTGLISMVFFTEHSICEADVGRRVEYAPYVELRLGAKTKAMISIPVFFAQRCRGVFSAVLFEHPIEAKMKEAFGPEDFDTLSRATALWSELMDSQLAGIGIQISESAARQ